MGQRLRSLLWSLREYAIHRDRPAAYLVSDRVHDLLVAVGIGRKPLPMDEL
jgi:hypothetical protein